MCRLAFDLARLRPPGVPGLAGVEGVAGTVGCPLGALGMWGGAERGEGLGEDWPFAEAEVGVGGSS